MEGVWRLLGYRRQDGCGYITYSVVVYIYILSYHGLTSYHLHGARLLAQY